MTVEFFIFRRTGFTVPFQNLLLVPPWKNKFSSNTQVIEPKNLCSLPAFFINLNWIHANSNLYITLCTYWLKLNMKNISI